MIYYIYADDKKEFVDECKIYLDNKEIKYLPFSRIGELDVTTVSHFLITGCLHEIKLLMAIAHQADKTLGIVATQEQKELKRTFYLPKKTEDAIKLALSKSEKKTDLLYCNDEIVLQEVVIGDAPPLDSFDTVLQGKSYLDRVKFFWNTLKRVKSLKHTQMILRDAKENRFKLSVVGLVALVYTNNTFASKLIRSRFSVNEGKFSLVILSPVSVVQYMGYLFKSLVSSITPKKLPQSVGYISSDKVTIESKNEMKVLIDSTEKQISSIELRVQEKALALSIGKAFWENQNRQAHNKDSVKIDHLPSDEESADYLSKSIPFFTHASKEKYASLFTSLREESRVSQTFMVLLVLATMIATFGLFINSASVIIGAMLLAPLMQPIVSLSMGVLRQDEDLEINGAKTIVVGVFSVVVTAALIAMAIPIEQLTSEMSGRLSPTILDLFVAVVSGGAAAYAKSNEKIVGSLAGVAIAVALVPPLAVAGIGLGRGEWTMFSTAMLLFMTNLVGIVLASALTFAILGYSSLRLAKKGIVVWMMIAAVVAVPLYLSFSQIQEDIQIQKRLENLILNVGKHHIKLTHIDLIHRAKRDEVYCEVMSSGILSEKEKKILKETILTHIMKEMEVIVTFRYRL